MKNIGRNFLYFLAVSMLLYLSPAFAQEKMTIEQAIDIGIKNSKTLNISTQKVLASRAKSKELRTNLYPALKLSATYTRLSQVDPFAIAFGGMDINITSSILDNYSAKLSLIQPIFMGNKITAGIDAADYSLDASNEDYSKDREDLVLNIKNAYWSLYKATEMKKVLDENVQQIQAHVSDAQNMMAQGMMTQNDVLKIQLQLSDVKYKQADANNAVQLAGIALDNALGISLTTQIEIGSGVVVKEFNNNDLTNLLSTSYAIRPELKAADLRTKAGEAGVTVAQSGWYPQLSLVGNYTYAKPNSRIFPTRDQFDGTWDVSLALSYDLWNWNATSYQTQQAEAQLLQARDAYSVAKDAVTLEVTQNYLNVNQAKEKISIAKLAQEQAEENFRVTGEKFKQGLALSSELIDAEVAYLQAKTNYTTSVVDYELALARLQKSVGEKSL
jgi:outer membrane protein TolC